MQHHTLILTQSMIPHQIVGWQDAICKMVEGEIEVLESYEETVSSPSTTFHIPSVARIKNYIPLHKKGVKWSRLNVLTRDKFTCQYCGHKFSRRDLNLDHVLPRCQGGQTNWQNIVSSCIKCNGRKGGRTPEQAKMKLLSKPARPRALPLTMPSIELKTVPEAWLPYLEGHFLGLEFG